MATKTWKGNAHAVKQIDQIDVNDVWAAGDTVTLTINTKDLIVTIGDDDTVQNVAAAIVAAWNATDRLTGQITPDATSNFGGQQHGEFAEATARLDPDDDTIVLIEGKKAGVPFTLSVTETTAGSGVATETTLQAATGPWHWDNGDNWTGGSAPANDDVVVFRDNNVPCLYSLPAGSLEVLLIIYASYTAEIGLRPINTSNAALPYSEYRQTHVALDESGGGTSLTHLIGVGDGPGSSLINIEYNVTTGLTVNFTVFNTGTPQQQGTKALNIQLANQDSLGTVTILRGSVQIGSPVGESKFATLSIANTGGQSADVDCALYNHTANLTVNQNGGTLKMIETAASSPGGNRTLAISGGTFIAQDVVSSGTVSITASNSTVVWNASKTIATLILGTKGVMDLEKDVRACTISTCDLFEGASLLDEFARGTYTAGVDLNRCGIDDVTIRVGNNRRLTLGTAA